MALLVRNDLTDVLRAIVTPGGKVSSQAVHQEVVPLVVDFEVAVPSSRPAVW
jgi:hypothetical protein